LNDIDPALNVDPEPPAHAAVGDTVPADDTVCVAVDAPTLLTIERVLSTVEPPPHVTDDAVFVTPVPL
jgi:hypothetical protein